MGREKYSCNSQCLDVRPARWPRCCCWKSEV